MEVGRKTCGGAGEVVELRFVRGGIKGGGGGVSE